MKKINLLFLIILLLAGCTKKIDIQLNQADSKVVIECRITNQAEPYTVKVTRTQSFSDNSPVFPTIDNASVMITDDAGNADTLRSIGNGLYQTSTVKTGVVNRTYNLFVTVDGKQYTATDILPAVGPITGMYYQYFKKDETHRKDGYYVFYSSTQDASKKNYFLYRIYRNNTLAGDPKQVLVTDNKFLSPTLKGIQLPNVYDTLDVVRLEIYSLSLKGYTFYYDLSQQLTNDGGFFSTPPANTVNNLSNGALGFFQVSSVVKDSVKLIPVP